ncbi:hypothetical protein RYX36_013322, partial [Vicia faba]
ATKFINNGAKVITTDIDEKHGQKNVKELGSNATFITLDVTKESDISDAIDFAVSKYKQLDIMYNNAGIPSKTPSIQIVRNVGVLKGAYCEASNVSNDALYLAFEDARYVSGHNLVVDGGLTSFKSLEFPAPDQVQYKCSNEVF